MPNQRTQSRAKHTASVLELVEFETPTPKAKPAAKRRRRHRKHEWHDREWDGPATAKMVVATMVPLVPLVILLIMAAMAG